MFTKPVHKNSGYIIDPFDPRDAWKKELELAGVLEDKVTDIPEAALIEGLTFDYQGGLPFCVSFATTTLIESKYETFSGLALSQPHLFFHSGGTTNGSTFRGNLNTALKKGCVKHSRLPMPDEPSIKDFGYLKLKADEVKFTSTFKIGGYLRSGTSEEEIKKSFLQYGSLLVGVAANSSPGNSYWSTEHKRVNRKDNHGLLLVGWDKTHWWLFDSLKPYKGFDGYHSVDISYNFNSVYAVTELPKNWQKQVEKTQKSEFKICLNHYGKPRNFLAEQKVAVELDRQFKLFNNQSVWEAAGKFWTPMINCVVYGNYSYRDLINFVYAWRRTGEYIFDLNKVRN